MTDRELNELRAAAEAELSDTHTSEFTRNMMHLLIDEIDAQQQPRDIVCDFCFVPNVKWSYPCADFIIPALCSASRGAWAACDDCHALIESDAWPAMLERCVAAQTLDAHERDIVRPLLERLHGTFRALRTGPATEAQP